jgi:cation transport ATPase
MTPQWATASMRGTAPEWCAISFVGFVVSTILSLPLIIFSPAGAVFGLPSIPPFGVSMGLLGFLLATPIVWWGGWPFISGAWRALRAGEVNMMTLIAVGILVSYFYSVAATFLFPGNVFYDAAAKAFARAMMAAFVAATAAKPGFGSSAALPDINTTEPFEALSASQARTVTRRAP